MHTHAGTAILTPVPLPSMPRCARTASAFVALVLTATGCGADAETAPASTPTVTPTLEAAWSIEDPDVLPVVRGPHHWMQTLTAEVIQRGRAGSALTWQRDVDLDPLGEPRLTGADEDVVVIADRDGESLCFDVADGSPTAPDTEACTALEKQLLADAPTLPLPSGEEVVLDSSEILIDPDGGPSREEQCVSTGSGIARISYDDETLVVTSVDPSSGKALGEVARIEQARFVAQFGDVLVARTGEDGGVPLSGFVLP